MPLCPYYQPFCVPNTTDIDIIPAFLCLEYPRPPLCIKCRFCPEFAVSRLTSRRVLDTNPASWTPAQRPGYQHCVLDTNTASWIPTLCPGYQHCVLDSSAKTSICLETFIAIMYNKIGHTNTVICSFVVAFCS